MDEFTSGFWVEAGGRFVEEDGRCVLQDGDGDAAFLAHPLGKIFQFFVMTLLLKTDAMENVSVILFAIFCFPRDLRKKIDVLDGGEIGIEHHILGDVGHFFLGFEGIPVRDDSVDFGFAFGRVDEI